MNVLESYSSHTFTKYGIITSYGNTLKELDENFKKELFECMDKEMKENIFNGKSVLSISPKKCAKRINNIVSFMGIKDFDIKCYFEIDNIDDIEKIMYHIYYVFKEENINLLYDDITENKDLCVMKINMHNENEYILKHVNFKLEIREIRGTFYFSIRDLCVMKRNMNK